MSAPCRAFRAPTLNELYRGFRVGNVVTPLPLLEEYGTDAVRYWAAKGGPGVDTAFDGARARAKRERDGPSSVHAERGARRRVS